MITRQSALSRRRLNPSHLCSRKWILDKEVPPLPELDQCVDEDGRHLEYGRRFSFRVAMEGQNKARNDDRSCLISLVVEAPEFVIPKIGDLGFFDEGKNETQPSAVAVDDANRAACRVACRGNFEPPDRSA